MLCTLVVRSPETKTLDRQGSMNGAGALTTCSYVAPFESARHSGTGNQNSYPIYVILSGHSGS